MTTAKVLGLTLLGSASLITSLAIAAPVANGGKKLTTTLTAAAEVPGPGDPAASGTAKITVNPGQGRVCWEVTTAGVDTAVFTISGAHIHSALAGQAGPIVVPLTAVANGTSTGCADVASATLDAIRKSPQAFYVNVHWTPTYAAGAIRGQLG
jgi:hypothetical protein